MASRRVSLTIAVVVGSLAVGGAFLLGRFTAPRHPQEVASTTKPEQPVGDANQTQPPALQPEPEAPARRAPGLLSAHELTAASSGVMGVWTHSTVPGMPMGMQPSLEPLPRRPVTFASLNVLDETNKVVAKLTTDSSGRYRLLLPPGRYRLEELKPYSGMCYHFYPKGLGVGSGMQDPSPWFDVPPGSYAVVNPHSEDVLI